ncbi:MAG: NADH-quinone oxidoreductase subunit E [Prevotellaceae bacterium]|jgi:formate hydrogenlyase subunit 3/multisubunit Na+/H+ antiporter MnhD subunit|nr:NADH-quinone oxidoreductase subunit E [Prevotellaceae bacterium]
MFLLIFLLLIVLASVIFTVPIKYKHWVATGLLFAGIIASAFAAYRFLVTNSPDEARFTSGILGITQIYIDSLSILFLTLISIAAATAFLFSKNYLSHYIRQKKSAELSFHYIAYLLLYYSMVGVVIFRNAGSFLLSWELMGISSFIIIILEGEQKEKLKAAIQYLVQMHIGFFILVAAFVLVQSKTGSFSFEALSYYFADNKNLPVFLLFFLGFGIKAGFVPLHTWLPETHSIAPGNVSAYMSGAVIKMGIFGLIRVLSSLQNQLFEIGIILLFISIITGLFGIAMAAIQKDIKRLLAYSSIENIGIIGIGLSVGLLGKYWDNYALMIAGFAGALIHTFNHSLFKSSLFFSAGLLTKAVHTQNMDKMGGAIKRMPYTSAFFLFGALGICALPPLNGFVSEFIMYNGFFTAIHDNNPLTTVTIVGAIITLALIGGLSVMAFSKVFGIAFLGEPRSRTAADICEAPKAAWQPLLIPLVIGIFPFVFIKLFCKISWQTFSIDHANAFVVTQKFSMAYNHLVLINLVLIAIIGLIWFIRHNHLHRHTVRYKPTWGCGYTAITPQHQYTSASFVSDFEHLTNPITRYKREMKAIAETEIFPHPRTFEGKEHDVIRAQLVSRPVKWINKYFFRFAIFQTGKLQHYVLYALLFMILILILTYFNII